MKINSRFKSAGFSQKVRCDIYGAVWLVEHPSFATHERINYFHGAVWFVGHPSLATHERINCFHDGRICGEALDESNIC